MAKRKKRTYPKNGTQRYDVINYLSIGMGKNLTEYFKGDFIYLKPSEAQQFINNKKIK